MNPTTWTAWKIRLLDLAEITDAWRMVPRTVLVFYGSLCWKLAKWYMALSTPPTTEQTAFVTAVIGLAVPMTAFYMQTGRKWQ